MPNYKTTSLKKLMPLFMDDKPYLIEQGGTGGGKTYPTLMLITSWLQSHPDRLWTVLGLDYRHLRDGAIHDFKNIMKNAEIWEPDRWSTTEKTYTFGNGSQLQFLSVDTMGAHGSRRDGLFVNEANGIDYNTFDQLATRTKGKVIIDYNPSHEFWAHTELLKKHPDDCDFIILTYKDNEALSDREVANIERHKPKQGEKPSNWWTVYGLGQIGSLEGNIYSGWRKATEDDYKHAKLIRYGLDFGFSNDETGMVAIWQTDKDEIIIEQKIYQTGLLGSQYGDKLRATGIDPSILIVADSARPEIIAEIKAQGFRIVGADKNAGSVLRGIDRVKQKQVAYDGKDLEREYLSYAWRTKRSGETLDEPQDGNDHCLAYGTKVQTIWGEREIGSLVGKSGWLYSENGKIRRFRNVRQTGIEETYCIKFANGAEIQCSAEHPFYTLNRGIVPASLLNEHDVIQCVMYGSQNHQRNKAGVQRQELLERQERAILSQRSDETACPTQSGVGISQWQDSGRDGYRPYRQESRQQSNRESEARHGIREQQECFGGNDTQTARANGKSIGKGERMAQVRGGESRSLRDWQEIVAKERAARKNMRPLWERLLYTRCWDKISVLLWELQNARKASQTDGASREYTKMLKKERAGKAPVYCLDVYDTSNFAVDGGIIVSNCMDALRYAIDDLSKPRFDF